jgi:Asp-tRNA(Asn)/Glu-tRNA(Gln) amidotransferase A subunit family amidase
MNAEQIPDTIIDRLRSNLRAADIVIAEADIQGVIDKGFLRLVSAFEAILTGTPLDRVPDYLAAWGDNGSASAVEPTPATPADQLALPFADAAERLQRPNTIAAIARQIQSRAVSPVELTEQALERIAQRDPLLNAFQLVLAERARAAAAHAEREIAAGAYRGPLHGVPIAVKDLLALAGTPTTAGSKILADWVADADSAGVERMERAGAVIVGKTRMPEFAYSPGSNNPHYGPTYNPWNREHDAGGSSSGSGVAVADGMVYAALGSDTGGSIRIPASHCGIVGLKPTFGRVSLHGAVMLSWSLDHLGPLVRSVADAGLMLAALAGHDPRDQRTRQASTGMPPADRAAGAEQLRIGVLRDDGTDSDLATPEVLIAWHAGLAALERGGAELIAIDLPEMEAIRVLNSAILVLEAAAYHETNLRARSGELGEFVRQRLLLAYALPAGAFIRAQQARGMLRQRFDAIFERVDLLSTPTMPYGAPLLGVPSTTAFTGPFNALGWPAITVPVGLTAERLPIGLQLAGKPWDEATVLRAAAVVEADMALPSGP